jgi:hypothetical protein
MMQFNMTGKNSHGNKVSVNNMKGSQPYCAIQLSNSQIISSTGPNNQVIVFQEDFSKSMYLVNEVGDPIFSMIEIDGLLFLGSGHGFIHVWLVEPYSRAIYYNTKVSQPITALCHLKGEYILVGYHNGIM